MKYLSQILILGLFFLEQGCGGGRSDCGDTCQAPEPPTVAPPTSNPPSGNDTSSNDNTSGDKAEDYEEELQNIADIFRESIKNYEQCIFNGSYAKNIDGCMREIHYNPQLKGQSSNGKRVLIIGREMTIPSLTKLSSNLVEYYSLDDQGRLVTPYEVGQPTGLHIPSPIHDFLSNESIQKSVIPPSALLSKAFFKLAQGVTFDIPLRQLRNDFPLQKILSNAVITKFRDLIPDVELVVVNVEGEELSLSAQQICTKNENEAIEFVREYYESLEESLNFLIDKHQINYVSLYRHPSMQELNGHLGVIAGCQHLSQISDTRVDAFVDLREAMFKRVANNHDIFWIQPAPSFELGKGRDQTFPACTNRADKHLLVTHVPTPPNGTPLLDISSQGEPLTSTLTGKHYDLAACNPIYFSLDSQADIMELDIDGKKQKVKIPVESHIYYDALGLKLSVSTAVEIRSENSDFIPPLVVAHIIYQKEKGISEPNILEGYFNNPVLAPQRYQQFPVCQLDERFCHSVPKITHN